MPPPVRSTPRTPRFDARADSEAWAFRPGAVLQDDGRSGGRTARAQRTLPPASSHLSPPRLCPLAPVTTSSLRIAHLGPIRDPHVLAARTTTPTQPLHHLPPSPPWIRRPITSVPPRRSPLLTWSLARSGRKCSCHYRDRRPIGYASSFTPAAYLTSEQAAHYAREMRSTTYSCTGCPPRLGLPTKTRV